MPRPNRLSRRGLLRAVAVAAATPLLVRAERSWSRHEYFDVTHVDVPIASLDPAHDGLRVAQLSDLHIGWGVPDGRIISAVNAVNAQDVDLVMLTGDFITTKSDPVSRVPQLLGRLEAPSVAVLGNHDHWTHPRDLEHGLEGAGISVLRNQHITLRLRSADFSIVGVDDSTTKSDDVLAAFKGQPTPQLILTHNPSAAKKLPVATGALCLSGHTHGGQLEIPNLTASVMRAFGEPYYRGGYAVRGNHLYVNRGLGFGSGTRYPRLNSDPEVTIFTLRHVAI